jgi:hypothetical protein
MVGLYAAALVETIEPPDITIGQCSAQIATLHGKPGLFVGDVVVIIDILIHLESDVVGSAIVDGKRVFLLVIGELGLAAVGRSQVVGTPKLERFLSHRGKRKDAAHKQTQQMEIRRFHSISLCYVLENKRIW